MGTSATERLINEIIDVEGEKYTNDPTDRGGPTKYGITQKALSAYRGYSVTPEDVANLTRAEAFKIYRKNYIIDTKFNLLEEVNDVIAAEVIDTGVNQGPVTSAKFLQRSLNALNHAGKYPVLTTDGVIGPKTQEALQGYLNQRGIKGEGVLLATLNALQANRYIEITEKSADQRKYFFGWMDHRVFAQLKRYFQG